MYRDRESGKQLFLVSTMTELGKFGLDTYLFFRNLLHWISSIFIPLAKHLVNRQDEHLHFTLNTKITCQMSLKKWIRKTNVHCTNSLNFCLTFEKHITWTTTNFKCIVVSSQPSHLCTCSFDLYAAVYRRLDDLLLMKIKLGLYRMVTALIFSTQI
jgi:hypothetical protein